MCIAKTSSSVIGFCSLLKLLQLPVYHVIAQLIITDREASSQFMYMYYNIIKNNCKACVVMTIQNYVLRVIPDNNEL